MVYFDSLIPDVRYYVFRKCHPEWVIEDSVIEFHDLSYVVSGKGVYVINGVEMPVSAGVVIYIPPGNRRQAWTSQRSLMEIYAINFRLASFGSVDNNTKLPFEFVRKLGYDPKLISLFAGLSRVWMEKEDMYKLNARALTLQIICELCRRLCDNKPVSRFDERIEKVKNYINENYPMPIKVTQLADMVGLNHVYLGSLFRQHESCSINEYINKIRINQAFEIIRTENLPIGDVALNCGYTDAFYFSRVFKKYIGMSPSQVY